MKAQPAHAALVPVTQHAGLDARIGDGDTAQPLRKPRQRIEHDTVIVDMCIALHDESVGEAESIKERDEAFDRRVGRRIAASRLIGKLVGRSEDVRIRVPRAGRRQLTRSAGMRHRPGDAGRIMGEVDHFLPAVLFPDAVQRANGAALRPRYAWRDVKRFCSSATPA